MPLRKEWHAECQKRCSQLFRSYLSSSHSVENQACGSWVALALVAQQVLWTVSINLFEEGTGHVAGLAPALASSQIIRVAAAGAPVIWLALAAS